MATRTRLSRDVSSWQQPQKLGHQACAQSFHRVTDNLGAWDKLECAKMVPTCLHILRAGSGFMGRMSQCFSVDFFLIYSVCKSHAASFWILFRGNCSIVTVDFGVFVGRESFRSLLCYLSSLTGTASSHFFAKCISSFLKKHRVALKYIHCHV